MGGTWRAVAAVVVLCAVGAAPAAGQEPVVSSETTFQWREIGPIDDLPAGMGITLVAGGPDGSLALVGYRARERNDGGLRVDHALFASSDGGAGWTRSRIRGVERIGVIAGGAQGFVVAPGPDLSNGHDRVWHSTDGVTWSMARLPRNARGEIIAAVATADGFLLGGRIRRQRQLRPAVWASQNGRSWTATVLDDREGEVQHVAVAPDGTAVATGRVLVPGEPTAPAIWRNDGSGGWEAVEVPDGFRGFIWGLGHVMDRFFIEGVDVIWRSDDGAAWERLLRDGPQWDEWRAWQGARTGSIDLRDCPCEIERSGALPDGDMYAVVSGAPTPRSGVWLGTRGSEPYVLEPWVPPVQDLLPEQIAGRPVGIAVRWTGAQLLETVVATDEKKAAVRDAVASVGATPGEMTVVAASVGAADGSEGAVWGFRLAGADVAPLVEPLALLAVSFEPVPGQTTQVGGRTITVLGPPPDVDGDPRYALASGDVAWVVTAPDMDRLAAIVEALP